MITDQDVEKLKKTFVTKDDFNKNSESIHSIIKRLEIQMNKNTERIIEAVGDMLKPKADADDINQQQRQIDNHESRIIALELK